MVNSEIYMDWSEHNYVMVIVQIYIGWLRAHVLHGQFSDILGLVRT